MFKKINAPLSLQWEVVPFCNYNCVHCYNYWRSSYDSQGDGYWELESANRIVDEIIKSKINAVTITGGEPLLIFEKIKPYIERFLEHGLKVSLNTNGSYIDDNIANYLGEKGIGILVSFPCSIAEINDKITNCIGSFEATCSGIKTASKHGVNVHVNMVVSKINQNYVVETAKYVKEKLGLKRFNATKAGKPLNASSDFEKYEMGLQDLRKLIDDLVFIKNEMDMFVDSLNAYPQCAYVSRESYEMLGARRNCSAGRTSAAIGYDGNLKSCVRAGNMYGNLLEDSLVDCWNRMSEWRDDSLLPVGCEKCNKRNKCAGACRVEAMVLFSSMNAPDPCMDIENIPVEFHVPGAKITEFDDIDQFLLSVYWGKNPRLLGETFRSTCYG